MRRKKDPALLTTQAGLVGWLIPGGGHFLLGMRGFALLYFVAISFCYLTGMLIGGAKGSVDPKGNPWLFGAEMGVGSYTGFFFMVAQMIPTMAPKSPSPYISYSPESDVAQIYLAVAGLLNILAVLDAMTRAQTRGMPVFYFEQSAQQARAEEAAVATAAATAPPAATGGEGGPTT